MKRYELLKSLIPLFCDALVVCNIGVPSQELYSLDDRENYFYMLGSMGMCSSIGLGLALSTERTVIAVEGDGAILMNLGSLATIANNAPNNFILLIVDNGTYGSTGDQRTYTQGKTSLFKIAQGAGCENVSECNGKDVFDALKEAVKSMKPSVIVAKVEPGNEPVAVIPLSSVWLRDRFKKAVLQSME